MFWSVYKFFPQTTVINSAVSVLCYNVSRHCGVNVGLIASHKDRDYLKNLGAEYSDFIDTEPKGSNGARLKLNAIVETLPSDGVLVDTDVMFTSNICLNADNFNALNYESIRFFKPYTSEERVYVNSCIPSCNVTINAGLLSGPSEHLKQYARNALKLGERINCLGHTFEQMYFVKYAEENSIPLTAVYPKKVVHPSDIEVMYQESGIRHPFCHKNNFVEFQRIIDISKEILGYDFVMDIFNRPRFRVYLQIAKKTLFPYPYHQPKAEPNPQNKELTYSDDMSISYATVK